MEPRKGLLMSLFFVAVGMSVDDRAPRLQHPLLFVAHVVSILAIGGRLRGLCRCFGSARGTASQGRLHALAGGEFGFALFGAAKALAVIDDLVFAMGVAIISVTMLLTPLLAARQSPGTASERRRRRGPRTSALHGQEAESGRAW
ncbi:MAG: cation:proton antiporter [Candidatus Accumulibacter sp.]|nr:cation:proton antiporter [Candidatus Accumulibacter propinquus]